MRSSATPKTKFPRLLAICFRNGGKGVFAERLDLLCKRQQRRTTRSERDAPTSTVEERTAELFFERLDLLRNSSLG